MPGIESKMPDFAFRTFKGMKDEIGKNPRRLVADEAFRKNGSIIDFNKPKETSFSEKLMATLPRFKRETQARIDARAKEIAELEDPKALQARIQALRFEQAVDKRHLESINTDLNNLNVIA